MDKQKTPVHEMEEAFAAIQFEEEEQGGLSYGDTREGMENFFVTKSLIVRWKALKNYTGAWLRVDPMRRTHTMGAKWLRNGGGMQINNFGESGQGFMDKESPVKDAHEQQLSIKSGIGMIGYGSPGKVQFLKDVTRSEKLMFVFLSETISSYAKMERLCSKLGFEGFIAVEPQGKSGGIAMFWKNADDVDLMSFSRSHIDVTVNTVEKESWRLTGIYGEPARPQRYKTWELLRNLSRDSNLPWCLVGDFNNVTSQTDKKGGHAYPNHLIKGFNECLHDAELQDLDIIGH
ncbi:hypothetical protein AgCh_019553 [Apium graveolens]